jgi:hypothetical protein
MVQDPDIVLFPKVTHTHHEFDPTETTEMVDDLDLLQHAVGLECVCNLVGFTNGAAILFLMIEGTPMEVSNRDLPTENKCRCST